MNIIYIEATVKQIVIDTLFCDKDTVTLEAKLHDLGADSLDTAEIVMDIEDAFGIDLSNVTVTVETNVMALMKAVTDLKITDAKEIENERY